MNEKNRAALRDSNLAVATNAIALVTNVVMNIAGNDIANTVNGQLITPAFLNEAVAARIQTELNIKGAE